jgi:hypothetical protein
MISNIYLFIYLFNMYIKYEFMWGGILRIRTHKKNQSTWEVKKIKREQITLGAKKRTGRQWSWQKSQWDALFQYPNGDYDQIAHDQITDTKLCSCTHDQITHTRMLEAMLVSYRDWGYCWNCVSAQMPIKLSSLSGTEVAPDCCQLGD